MFDQIESVKKQRSERNRFCLPYISPGVSFVCHKEKYLKTLIKLSPILAPLVFNSKILGFENWRVFIQSPSKSMPKKIRLKFKQYHEQKNSIKDNDIIGGFLKKIIGRNNKLNEICLDLPVYRYSEMDKFPIQDVIFFSGKLTLERSESLGEKYQSLFILLDPELAIDTYKKTDDLYASHLNKIQSAAELLCDYEDRMMFLEKLLPYQSQSFFSMHLSNYEQYFHPIAGPREGDWCIDGGVSQNLKSDFEIAKVIGPKGKLFGFEPDPDSYEVAKAFFLNHQDICNVEMVKLGLWSEDKEMKFFSGLRGGSFIKTTNDNDDSTLKKNVQVSKEIAVKMTSIDKFVKERMLPKIDFIKLDIEGSEMNALLGAKETLVKYKPRLAVCAYHKVSDAWEIPSFLKSLSSDGVKYDIYFGNHRLRNYEFVFYANPKS